MSAPATQRQPDRPWRETDDPERWRDYALAMFDQDNSRAFVARYFGVRIRCVDRWIAQRAEAERGRK